MNRKWIAGVALGAFLAIPSAAGAHEGHAHKVMGTVSSRGADHVEVRTTKGKTVRIAVNDETAVLRGKEKLAVADVKEGDRVVVDLGKGKEPLTAREIRLGQASSAASDR